MSQSTHQIAVTGVDHTAAAFQSIQARAIAAGNRITRVMGGAIAAAGAYLSFRSIGQGVQELSNLSDMAQAAKASVGDLTAAATALQVIGITMEAKDIAKTFELMRKNTGREGMAGFYETLEEIGKIPDAAERSAKAMEVFGRSSGLSLMPIIDAAGNGTEALQGVVAAMPRVSDTAAKAADDTADAFKNASREIKATWLGLLGDLASWFNSFFVEGVSVGLSQLLGQLKVDVGNFGLSFAQAFKAWVIRPASALGAWIGADSVVRTEGAFEKEWKYQTQLLEEQDRENFERVSKWQEELEEKLRQLRALQDNIKKATGDGEKQADNRSDSFEKSKAEAATAAAVEAAARITNQMISGGSNAAQRLSILGPEYRNEQKKQTELLRDIAKNTAKTADNTDDGEAYAITDLGA